MTEIRPFARIDRDQVTDLANAHIAAVVPNTSISTQSLLSQLEREPGEYVVDPWVVRRETLVAVRRERIVAAAHLLQYADDDRVSGGYRNAGEIRWLLCWPDATDAGADLAAACLARMAVLGLTARYADGTLPAPGVYGVPEQWPHIREIYRSAGFGGAVREEVVYIARVVDLLKADAAPIDGIRQTRSVGVAGTRIAATLAGNAVGYIEVDTNLDSGGRVSRFAGWADVGNLYVEPPYRRRGLATWLLGTAARWLDLGGVTRLLDYADADSDYAAFLEDNQFDILTRTVRGLRHEAGGVSPSAERSGKLWE